MTRALLDRLAVCFEEEPAHRVMAGQAAWDDGSFGSPIDDLRAIVLHQTGGWPSRGRVEEFVDRYIAPGTPKRGIGPQFYVSGDGTCMRVIDVPRVTYHASFVNTWSLGIEIGNLFTTAPPPGSGWVRLSDDDADDVLGARAHVRSHAGPPREVVAGWWTTAAYAGPQRAPVGAGCMLFSDAEYRALARLARWLAEAHRLPRNLPLLPHAMRGQLVDQGETLRRIALADPACAELVAAWAPLGVAAADLQSAAAFQARYAAAIHAADGATVRHNRLWLALFDVYRGFHGHGFSGAIAQGLSDHDCPGPLFDWHRFARGLWDWWWFPFDVAAAGAAPARRPYQRPTGRTPLVEYWFDEDEAARTARVREGCHGATSSPETFRVEAGTPVYAMANGALVAARLGPADPARPSEGFALVRHELFHVAPPHALHGAGIDYAVEPTCIYTLTWHLGGADLDAIAPGNPDWLNRALARRRECDLGAAFADGDAIPAAHWKSTPPGAPPRPTMLAGWQADRDFLGELVGALRGGGVAIGPRAGGAVSPIDVLLGDHLGAAGVCSTLGGAVHGVRVEAFATALLPGFTQAAAWSAAPNLAVHAQSEHARTPTAGEAARLVEHGFTPAPPSWWPRAVQATAGTAAPLPADGVVWHYRALDVARWIDQLTWKHERTKYRSPTAAAMARPPSRRR